MRGLKLFGIRMILNKDFLREKAEAWEDGFESCKLSVSRINNPFIKGYYVLESKKRNKDKNSKR